MKAMLLKGEKMTKEKAKEWCIDDDDSADSDFDIDEEEYDYVGGESATYKSRLYQKDEILFLKTVFLAFDQQT